MGTMIDIASADAGVSFPGYLAVPPGGKGATVVVIQEIFGVNEGVRRKCDDLARAGFIALAPDLFWRTRPGITFDPDVPEELQASIAFIQNYDRDAGVRDVAASIAQLRNWPGANGKVGAVGYCMGGTLAYLTAARTDVDAAVGYYALLSDETLAESGHIKKPFMLHIPLDDFFVVPAVQRAMHATLDTHPLVTVHDYAGADHGFAEYGKRRNEKVAAQAEARTIAFLNEHLT